MATVSTLEKQNAEQLLIAFVKENFPDLETRFGSAFRSLVIAPAAAFFALIQEEATKLQNSQSLLAALESEEVEEEVVEQILSNWFITRNEGGTSRGTIKVLVATNKAYEVTTETQFRTENGLLFTSEIETVYTSSPTETQEKLFVGEKEGTYFFLVPVVANQSGTAGNVVQGTRFVLDALSFIDRAVISLEAFTPFSGGTEQESLEDLIERSQVSITVRDLVTYKSITSVLRDEFPNFVHIQPIGFGDPEMLRDVVYPTQIHTGGSVDVFVRGSRTPERRTLRKQIIGSPLQIVLVAPEAPIYRVDKIEGEIDGIFQTIPTSSYTVEYDSYNWFQQGLIALAEAPKSARFSDRERVIITFNDPSFFQKDVLITVTVPIGVVESQAYLEVEENRVLSAKMLARGFCPVFINFTLDIIRKANEQPVDEAALKQSILDYVNTIEPGEPLKVSRIVDIVHNFGVDRLKLPLVVRAEVFKTDGTSETQTGDDVIQFERDTIIGFSQRICQFFIEENDITINETIE